MTEYKTGEWRITFDQYRTSNGIEISTLLHHRDHYAPYISKKCNCNEIMPEEIWHLLEISFRIRSSPIHSIRVLDYLCDSSSKFQRR